MKNFQHISILFLLMLSCSNERDQYTASQPIPVPNASGLIERKEYDSAIIVLNQSLIKHIKTGDLYKAGQARLDLGLVYHLKNKLDSARFFYELAQNNLKEVGDSLFLPNTYLNLAIIYKKWDDYERALVNSLKAAEFLNTPTKAQASNLSVSGSIHNQLQDYERSLEYYHEALATYTIIGDSIGMGKVHNNIGNVLAHLNYYDSAITNYRQSLKIKIAKADSLGISTSLNNIGWMYLQNNSLDSAKRYLNHALFLKQLIADSLNMANTMNQLGKLYLSKKELNKAHEYFSTALQLAESKGLLDVQKESLQYLAEYYHLTGNFEQQGAFLTKQIDINKLILDEQKVIALENNHARYQSVKKDNEILSLAQKEETQRVIINQQKKWILAILITSIFILLLLVIAINLYRNRKRDSERIDALNKEMQHRIKNNLQLLSNLLKLHSKNVVDPNALDALKTGESRVNAMNIVHQLLYTNIHSKKIRLREYVGELCQYLSLSYQLTESKIKVNNRTESTQIDVDTMVSIGLIINELVTNAIKHAGNENDTIEISVNTKVLQSNSLFLEIRDNGKGLPNIDCDSNGTSFGLGLVRLLSKQIRAECTIFNRDGAVFQFSIPCL